MTKTSPVPAADGGCQLTADRIRRAEEAIAGLRSQFICWVRADLDSIDAHLEAARTATSPEACAASLEELRRLAHNIKGQGGTFGCDDLSATAAELDGFLKRQAGFDALCQAGTLAARLKEAFEREAA